MGTMKRHKSIVDALQYVADHPVQSDDTIDVPAWELIGRSLFDIANNPNPRVRGSEARATKASKMIANRLTGRRKAGTEPAVHTDDVLEFDDLTGGAISE